MNRIKKFFTGKKMKYGSMSVVFTIVFIAILVFVNLIVGKYDAKVDLTKNKIFSFEDQTVNMLKELDKPVNIYGLYPQGSEDEFTKQILERYKKGSKHINVEYIDPDRNPGFLQKYSEEKSISNGSIIFESGDKFKIVEPYDLINYNYQTGTANSLKAEEQFTSSILYVTSDKIPTVYFVKGHGEKKLYDADNILEKENYQSEELNLITNDIPEEAEAIVIASPQRDFSAEEIEKLDKYFDRGGRALFLFDFNNNDYPKLTRYLTEWGVELQKDLIVEGNTNNFSGNPTFIVPNLQSHEITGKIKSNNLMLFVPTARSIDVLFDEGEGGIKVTSILKTSDNSWGKVNFESETSNIAKEKGDIEGPLNVAVAVTRPNYSDDYQKQLKDAKIFIMGSTEYLNPNIMQIPGLANVDFFMNTINWMQDAENKISIRPKNLAYERMVITQGQKIFNAALVVIVIPLIIFILGGVVWTRRRHL